MKKLIAFDIDGTLLIHGQEIPASTKESIRKLKEQGHEVAIATGRNYKSAIEVINELELDTYIVSNGGVGYINHEKKYHATLDKKPLKALIDLAASNGDQLMFATDSEIRRHFDQPGKAMDKIFDETIRHKPDWDQDFWEQNDIVQCMLFCRPESLASYQIDGFRLVSWHEYGFDVIDQDMSKAKTILKIAADKGIAQKDVIFFGDGHNDIEALAMAGIGVAMGNAADEVKKHADFLTDSVYDDGIYKALKKLELI